MASVHRITPCLWFDDQAERAARFYVGIFPNSKITLISRYGEAGREVHGQPAGKVMTAAFELDGQPFTALNGGPLFQPNQATSFVVHCETQQEVDYYWDSLSAGGDPSAQQCGWLKDKFGFWWQVVPAMLPRLLLEPVKADKVMTALLKMKKLDIAALERAASSAPSS